MKTNYDHVHTDTRIALLEKSIEYLKQDIIRLENMINNKLEVIDKN